MDSYQAHFIGVLGGLGAIGIGYVLSKVSQWTDLQTQELKQQPRYYNFSKLDKDLAKTVSGSLHNVFIEGVVAKEFMHRLGGGSTLEGQGGIEGPAKLVQTTQYSKVYNSEKQKWQDHTETMVNQCISVPFKFMDDNGNSVTVENVHNASNLVSILNLVNQSKTLPEQRTIGDHATNMVLREIPSGSLTKEYLLLYGTRFGALGEAIQMDKGTLQQGQGGGGNIVFIPYQVASSISYLISSRELIAKVEKVVSSVLLIGGTIITGVELYFLFHQRQNNQS